MYVCPLHSVSLITRDPRDSAKTLDSEALDVRFATTEKCDLALLPIDVRRVPNVTPEEYILGRLGFMPRSKHETLDLFSLGEAIDLIDRIGTAAVGGARAGRDCGIFASRDVLFFGYTVISEGRVGLLKLFEKLKAEAGVSKDEWMPRAKYGPLYSWLFHASTRDVAGLEPIRQAMLEVIGTPSARDLTKAFLP